MSWQHVSMGDLMSQKGFSDQTASFFFFLTAPSPLPISISRFSCFPLLTPGRTKGERRALPTFQHIPNSKCLGTAAHCWHSFAQRCSSSLSFYNMLYLSVKCRPFEAVGFHQCLGDFHEGTTLSENLLLPARLSHTASTQS